MVQVHDAAERLSKSHFAEETLSLTHFSTHRHLFALIQAVLGTWTSGVALGSYQELLSLI